MVNILRWSFRYSEVFVFAGGLRGAVRGGVVGLALSGLYALYNNWDHLKGNSPTRYWEKRVKSRRSVRCHSLVYGSNLKKHFFNSETWRYCPFVIFEPESQQNVIFQLCHYLQNEFYFLICCTVSLRLVLIAYNNKTYLFFFHSELYMLINK